MRSPRKRHPKKQSTVCITQGPGPTGPAGPVGPLPAVPATRILKVQLVTGVPTPIFNEGFDWENDVPEPDNWPVAGNFIFHKATMLDISPFPISELYSVYGGITHGDVTPNIDHQAVIAHYRGDLVIDFHVASSRLLGTSDSLLAQSLQDAVIGDRFYFAISPDIADLLAFNYNLGSLRMNQAFKIPDDLPITVPNASTPPGVTRFLFKVTVKSDIKLSVTGNSGGGGAGQESTNDGVNTKIGRGGGGGGSFSCFFNDAAFTLETVEVLELVLPAGGIGGTAADADGKTGEVSTAKVSGFIIGGAIWNGPNPVLGGLGGSGGVTTGDGGGGGVCGPTEIGGGGGGAPLINGAPGTAGTGGGTGDNGGTNPRKGGNTTGSTGGTGGTTTGTLSMMGSGGGAGGSGGDGGNGGSAGQPGSSGEDGPVGGGGGGGSGGLGGTGSTITGGDGGTGSNAFAMVSLFT